MNKTIWMYWENKKGSTKPAYLDLCLESIIKHSPNYKVIVLDEKTVFDYLPDLRTDINKIVDIAHKADYIRARMIHKFGGIWLDSDVILLKEIEIEKYLKEYEYVGSSSEYGKPSIWFFGGVKNCEVLNKWYLQMDKILDVKLNKTYKESFKQQKYLYLSLVLKYINIFNLRALKKKSEKFNKKYLHKVSRLGALGWSEIGYDILWKLFENYKYKNIEFEKFAPLKFDQWNDFFKNDIYLKDMIKDDTISIMLYNKFMFEPLKDMSREEILESNNLLGQVFRYSLSN